MACDSGSYLKSSTGCGFLWLSACCETWFDAVSLKIFQSPHHNTNSIYNYFIISGHAYHAVLPVVIVWVIAKLCVLLENSRIVVHPAALHGKSSFTSVQQMILNAPFVLLNTQY
jgi:hypothetical protein